MIGLLNVLLGLSVLAVLVLTILLGLLVVGWQRRMVLRELGVESEEEAARIGRGAHR